MNNKSKGKYYFLTTSSECYIVLYTTFYFANYSMLSVTDELCMYKFHFILLVIKLDAGLVMVLDSRCKETKEWANMSQML